MDEVIESLRYRRRVTIGALVLFAFLHIMVSAMASVGIVGLAIDTDTWICAIFWFMAVSGSSSAMATFMVMTRIGNHLMKINKALRDFSQG